MNKTELVSAMAEKAGISKVGAKKALDAMLETVKENLVKGDDVVLMGFGTFTTTKREARKGINPLNKKPINVPAKRLARFKVGANLKNSLK